MSQDMIPHLECMKSYTISKKVLESVQSITVLLSVEADEIRMSKTLKTSLLLQIVKESFFPEYYYDFTRAEIK